MTASRRHLIGALAALSVALLLGAVALVLVPVRTPSTGVTPGSSCTPLEGLGDAVSCGGRTRARLVGATLAGVGAGVSALVAFLLAAGRQPTTSLRALEALFALVPLTLGFVAIAVLVTDEGAHFGRRLVTAAGSGIVSGLFGLLALAIRSSPVEQADG